MAVEIRLSQTDSRLHGICKLSSTTQTWFGESATFPQGFSNAERFSRIVSAGQRRFSLGDMVKTEHPCAHRSLTGEPRLTTRNMQIQLGETPKPGGPMWRLKWRRPLAGGVNHPVTPAVPYVREGHLRLDDLSSDTDGSYTIVKEVCITKRITKRKKKRSSKGRANTV